MAECGMRVFIALLLNAHRHTTRSESSYQKVIPTEAYSE